MLKRPLTLTLTLLLMSLWTHPLYALDGSVTPVGKPGLGALILIALVVLTLLGLGIFIKIKSDELKKINDRLFEPYDSKEHFSQYIQNLNSDQIKKLLNIQTKMKKNQKGIHSSLLLFLLFSISMIFSSTSSFAQFAQNIANPTRDGIFSEGGVIIILILIMIPIIGGLILMAVKVKNLYRKLKNKSTLDEADRLANYLNTMPNEEITDVLLKRQRELDYSLSNQELAGEAEAKDPKGIINLRETNLPVVAAKKKAGKRPQIDAELAKLVLWFILTSTFWLIFGTTVGEYVGIKFIVPDADHLSWLSFGRLRPVHTNSVFWGFASLGMLAMGYYSVPRVGNTKLYSYKLGWIALYLINFSVVLGTILLMAGINNGGGEFREYIWPAMLPFAVALILTLYNFMKTVAQRKTKEIYISNWYMIAALIFGITIVVVAYIPFWQNGLGETIIQGYYMHQGVGMWFMMFTLGIVYYFLPQQLNKPIYSYSLGILAYWTQILFYTLIGTHHFIFSSIPWWLQTVAIIGSMGMVIPVTAGTTNFIMTFKGAWHKVSNSYTLPFFIVGTIFYFTGSLQGTAEAFRSSNLIWHFTDFTVAHSHLTMYGIIAFYVWGAMYAVIPRLTGKEPPQITVGAHFWLALIGLIFYTFPLMYGGTLRGLSWIEGKPFIESVVLMGPHWLWRAIGGSLMWASHLFFAYNIYKMYSDTGFLNVKDEAIKKLESKVEA